MASLQKNVAGQNVTFTMINATTGAVDASATVTVKVVKDNGTQASGAGTVTNSGNGQYNYAPTQAETNGTNVGFLFTATGDIAVSYSIWTDLTDAGGNVQVDVVKWNNQTAQTDANNLPKVDVEDINGNATAAQNVSKANQAIGRGTATTGGSTTSIPTSAWTPGGAGVVSGQFIGRTIIFDANTATAALQGQATTITANTAGATPTFTVTALTTAPSSGDTFGVY